MPCESKNILRCGDLMNEWAECQKNFGHIVVNTSFGLFARNYMDDCNNTECEYYHKGEEK